MEGTLLPDACSCPAPVSQAPREAPARRAPSSAVYLEEKSDQQKKEEVGMENGWPWGGHGVPLAVAALRFSSLTHIGTGASLTPAVGDLDGETFQSPEADCCRPWGIGLSTRKPGKGREGPRSGLAHLNQSQRFRTQVRLRPWRVLERL